MKVATIPVQAVFRLLDGRLLQISRPVRPATIIFNVRAVGAIEVVVKFLESRGVRLDGRKRLAGVVSLGVRVNPSSVVAVSVIWFAGSFQNVITYHSRGHSDFQSS